MQSIAMTDLIVRASDHVISLFQSKLPVQYHYHTLEHTISVVDFCKEIGAASGIDEKQMDLLMIAAWFHDSGYTQTYKGHELASCVIARSFLTSLADDPDTTVEHFDESDLEAVIGCIMATQVPQVPKHPLEEIICDADLVYLGTNEFDKWSHRLRKEWEFGLGKQYTDKDWLKVNIDFIKSHSFHTDYCLTRYNPRRMENLARIEAEHDAMP